MLHRIKQALPPRHPVRLAWHWLKAWCAAVYYGFPARCLTVIGVTGTDGKTTTVGMITHILRSACQSVGSLSTARFTINDQVEFNATQKTSISPFELQRRLRMMVRAGCRYAVIEASSHGLVQGRLNHLYPRVAAMTNLSEEHLDYHGSMEQYARDKGRLFDMLRGRGTKVLNGNDRTYPLFSTIPSNQTVVYHPAGRKSGEKIQGSADTEYWLSDRHVLPQGCTANLHISSHSAVQKLALNIPGLFNLGNALCAIGCCRAVGVSLQQCLQSLRSYNGEYGRMQRIEAGQNFSVFVDFTVTPAAYETVLTTLRAMLLPGGRLHVLTGSCGNRMIEKRPVIGRICSRLADTVVVTSDETYGEAHEKIMNEICAGIDQNTCVSHRITDRRQAIDFILAQARPGDIVAICGMAGTTTMMTAQGQIPWNEAEIVHDSLKALMHH